MGLANPPPPHGEQRLTGVDYGVIAAHIAVSVAVGLYAARRQRGGADYFLAGRSAPGWVIAVSLISGLASGISYLGLPGYTYVDGVPFALVVLSLPPAIGLTAWVILPFFHGLGLFTAYAYLELRFARPVRTCAAAVFVFRVVVYLSIVLYAPALALNTMTGLPIWATILGTGVLATLYTVKGGMAAVLYTDFLQSLLMIACALAMVVTCLGRLDAPVLATLRRAHNTTATIPPAFWHFKPTHNSEPPAESVFQVTLGYTFLNLGQMATDQIAVQRYLTARSATECRRSLLLNGVAQAAFLTLMAVLGWCLFAFYHQHGRADPLAAGRIGSKDQVSPYFALTELPHGFAGLLVAAVLGSTMSVFSGGVNSAATSCVVDLLQGALGWDLGEGPGLVRASRLISAAVSVVAIAIAFAASAVKGLVKMGVIATGLSTPILGVFLLGMFTARCGPGAALTGLAAGFLTVLYLAAGNIVCSAGPDHLCHGQGALFAGGRVSVFWFGFLGTAATVGVGTLASLCLPRPDPRAIAGLTFATRHALGKHRQGGGAGGEAEGGDADDGLQPLLVNR